jgi:hypothetical protein
MEDHKGMSKKLVSLLAVCGVVLLTTALPVLAAGKTHEVKAEVVSVDAKAATLTIKDEKGGNKTVPVLDSAKAQLNSVKAGDHVMLTCQDNEKGEHTGVTAIKVEHAEKPA